MISGEQFKDLPQLYDFNCGYRLIQFEVIIKLMVMVFYYHILLLKHVTIMYSPKFKIALFSSKIRFITLARTSHVFFRNMNHITINKRDAIEHMNKVM